MRHNKDLDKLESMRKELEKTIKIVSDRAKASKYMSSKTANNLLIGAVAASVVALPLAAAVGAAVLVGTVAAAGATVAVAGLNKLKAAQMEASRSGHSGFLSKASMFLKEHSEVYKEHKRQHEENQSSPVGADLVQYQQELKQELAQKQQLAIEQRENNQPRQSQNKGNNKSNEFELSLR